MNPSASEKPAAPGKGVRLLDQIRGPADVKTLPADQLPLLAEELRSEIIAVTAANGGHVAPNLGVIELTIALHRVFSTPEDQFVFDVSHQCYAHKLLTGRGGEAFWHLRQTGGLSGFMARAESPHDAFGAGHAGTALSVALGLACARDLRGTREHVIALCGDAAFTCGITMEALNNVVTSTKRLIVILNDNEWAISKNVGAVSRYLNRLSTNPTYNKIHHDLEKFFTGLPHGHEMHSLWMKWKRETKDFIVESSLFEKYGLRYLGPIDGHNIPELIKNLEFAKSCDSPILLHVLTKKGKGLDAAQRQPEKFHGLGSFDPVSGESLKPAPGTPPNYQDFFGQALARFAKADPRVVGITAAMASGTGLSYLAAESPKQFFDVGIAEEHAVLFAGGLASRGLRPVCALYSTFLQRAYDPVIHDICLQNLPVVFCIDRAGLSPNDGPTHHGLFDLAFTRCVPNAVVMQPRDEDELVDMLHTALNHDGPSFMRYPRGSARGVPVKPKPALLPLGQAEIIRPGSNLMIWALGPMVHDALRIADKLASEDGISCGVVNTRFVKPIDRNLLLSQAACIPLLVTMEDHVLAGGFGSAVLEALHEAECPVAVERIGWPDRFIEHGTNVEKLRADADLSFDSMYRRVRDRYRNLSSAPVEIGK